MRTRLGLVLCVALGSAACGNDQYTYGASRYPRPAQSQRPRPLPRPCSSSASRRTRCPSAPQPKSPSPVQASRSRFRSCFVRASTASSSTCLRLTAPLSRLWPASLPPRHPLRPRSILKSSHQLRRSKVVCTAFISLSPLGSPPNNSLHRTRRQSLRSFLLAGELDIVSQLTRSHVRGSKALLLLLASLGPSYCSSLFGFRRVPAHS